MKKLSLNIDELRVETFITQSNQSRRKGTVKGLETKKDDLCIPGSNLCSVNCTNRTCNPTCDDDTCYFNCTNNCTNHTNCGQFTCDGTCNNSCGGTCNNTLCGGYTCEEPRCTYDITCP